MIVAPNHPALWDAVFVLAEVDHAACVLKAALMNNPILFGGATAAGFIPNEPTHRMLRQCIERLRHHAWPGNVRELKHVIERGFILATGDEIGADSIRIEGEARGTLRADDGSRFVVEVGASIRDVEKRLILTTLERLRGDKKQTAEVLGISLKTLYNRLNAYRAA